MTKAETFLGGRVVARQPASGYRASLDSVLLGAAIDAGAGESLIELGCGSGAALLIAAERNPEASFVGVERDKALATLAADNVKANPGAARRADIVEGDALQTRPDWRERFDQAFLNPPFYDDPDAVRPPRDPARRAAFLTGEEGLAGWIAAALALVPTRGLVTLVHRADRLADVLSGLSGPAGEIRVRPVHPRAPAPASRILVRARKGAKTRLALLPALVLHREDGGWDAEAAAVLQGAAGLALEA